MGLIHTVEPSDTDDVADASRDETLLLVTMVRLRQGPRGLQLDDQTCAGLGRWAERFKRVVFCGLLMQGDAEDDTSVTWLDVDTLPASNRLRFLALPFAYKVGAFSRAYRATRALLAEEVSKADRLCFTIGCIFGDWGAVGGLEAIRQGRKFAVWFDRVEYDVLRNTLHTMSFKRRIKERMTLPLMKIYHHYLVRRSSLGLFQGMDTFNAFAASSSNPACVYDVHTQREDFIAAADVMLKAAQVEAGVPLKVAYVGRAAAMKGPEDWLRAIHGAVQAGVELHATWLGDGPLLPQMRSMVDQLGLAGQVELVGYVGDRETVLDRLRQSHLLLFCHKTAESPRCLIEALVSGCPIVGYGAPYPQGLVEGEGGGAFSRMDDFDGLSALIVALDRDRKRLAGLVRDAAATGRKFDEATLYRKRAGLIAAHA